MAGRPLLPVGGAVTDRLEHLADVSAGIMSIPATLSAISDRIAELDAILTDSGKPRTSIRWPALPANLD